MPWPHLLLLALGILLIALAGLDDQQRHEQEAITLPAGSVDFGRPDMQMETAEISRFDTAGALAYRIRAVDIVHFPDADHTQLETPRLTLRSADAAPWELSARRGRVFGGIGLLDAGTEDLQARPREEIVELVDDVLVRRERPGGGFLELRTDALTLHPGREFAEASGPVTIDTELGRTRAEGLYADLGAGTLVLGQAPATAQARVRTILFPGQLPGRTSSRRAP